MEKPFRPAGYNALSPYFVVRDAQRFADWVKTVFDATELRRGNIWSVGTQTTGG